MSPDQRERNSSILQLFKSGKSQADIGRQFGITPGRVRQIIVMADRMEQRRAELVKKYGTQPIVHTLPDSTPFDVLVLCNANIHGWSVRVANLAHTSLKIKTLGDLRRTADEQLLREPSIGEKMVTQLRLFCPFRARGVTDAASR
jgi:hypothetical protein